ncbi:MAG: sigma 54-interacting transcriptional regulator [Polaromonas sp.]|nr:sigma 54-interacting transcriptional regulator [Polaromonas sp.]
MPDVMIVYFQLPGMDGLEVIRALRRIDEQVRTVVDRALTDSGTRRALAYYQRREADLCSLDCFLGESAPMAPLRDLVRAIAASEPLLAALVQTGQFRRDLLYRLRVLQISIPPLRWRGDDARLLDVSRDTLRYRMARHRLQRPAAAP